MVFVTSAAHPCSRDAFGFPQSVGPLLRHGSASAQIPVPLGSAHPSDAWPSGSRAKKSP